MSPQAKRKRTAAYERGRGREKREERVGEPDEMSTESRTRGAEAFVYCAAVQREVQTPAELQGTERAAPWAALCGRGCLHTESQPATLRSLSASAPIALAIQRSSILIRKPQLNE